MTIKVDITPEMQRRLSEIARSSRRSESQLISAALENGHALEWQERLRRGSGRGSRRRIAVIS